VIQILSLVRQIGALFANLFTSPDWRTILDIVIMWLFVNILPLTPILEKVLALVSYSPDAATLATINYWFVKIFISAVLVTILNYVFSKVLIFGKKKKKDTPTE